MIEKGAKLVTTGTSTDPIIFTSDESLAPRALGDWGGIVFDGPASNNNSNSLKIRLSSTYTITGDDINDADNSGSFQFVQVHFGDAGYSTDVLSKSAHILNSVGTATIIDHVQITNSKYDGIGMYGGLVDMNNIVSYDAGRTDFPISYGYQGNIQFITAMRIENTAVPTGTAYDLEITNQTTSDITTTPLTQPVISNLTVLGPNYCSPTTVNSQFDYASAGKIYNSVFSAWKSTATHSGLLMDKATCFNNTASRDLIFSYNSFDRSGTGTAYFDGALTPWSGAGCSSSMAV